jgi:GIY-YIG catalytic domain
VSYSGQHHYVITLLAVRPKQGDYRYFYGTEDGSIGYIGQTIDPAKRRRDHAHGRHDATLELNAILAERGKTATFMFWQVDTKEHSLNEWEAHYAQKYRERGTTVVNRTVGSCWSNRRRMTAGTHRSCFERLTSFRFCRPRHHNDRAETPDLSSRSIPDNQRGRIVARCEQLIHPRLNVLVGRPERVL